MTNDVQTSTAREALMQLLTENPGHVVTVAMVCERLGRVVSRNVVSHAAGVLGRKWCVGRPGCEGGYLSRVAL